MSNSANFNVSEGWFQQMGKRHKHTKLKQHGKSNDVDQNVIKEWIIDNSSLLVSCDLGMYNCDETISYVC